MVKKFTIPFASQGDANDIPDALQVDGKVSFTQGFGYDYERPYDDPQAKDISREDMNGIFKAITSAVGELQTLGASEWSSAISYPKGSIVYFEKDLYISQVDDNQNEPPQSWVSITSIANDSLKKAMNLSDLTDKTVARNNLGLGSSATLNKTDVLGTSSNLVATQKLVNDTKINLESSKQDKLTFVGDGPEVMRAGAFGLGAGGEIRSTNIDDANIKSGFYYAKSDVNSVPYNSSVIHMKGEGEGYGGQIAIKQFGNLEVYARRLSQQEYSEWERILTETNVTNSLGTSTTLVASQKLVNDVKQSGLGYNQNWVDVKSQRAVGTTYTNNTGKPIFISITVTASASGASELIVDGLINSSISASNFSGTIRSVLTTIVPHMSTYSLRRTEAVLTWMELR